ncbi:MAG: PPOX class F420-dependent oxidoreductase [Armatimonadota bacterium]|nr:PPOX class F420-dependent oxidoreductase [Armatimonadota bacterium]MDR7519234.1 PPOX class F420-dependent oxidoreductase [Armatimonadota bacterium]MDR7550327.1 PPOX class F420-dependent oxidoreductase [Armatimonadota bacterium]
MSVTFDEHVRAFLSEPLAAVLATVSPRGRPQATPVWFVLEDSLILVNTSRGRVKLRNMEANRHVSLSIVDPRNMYRYVQIRGEAVRFDPQNGARDIDRLSMRYTGKPYSYPGGQRPEDRVSVLIKPRSVSGWRG